MLNEYNYFTFNIKPDWLLLCKDHLPMVLQIL
jgi:hypothetical protein